jgi:hypothetical protein
MQILREEYSVAVIVAMVGLVAAWFYINRAEYELKCIVAGKDGNKFCVRDRKNAAAAAALLAEATERMKTLVAHLKEKYPDNAAVKRLVAGFDPAKISETLPNTELTAYTENKSKMSFCLTDKKEGARLIDINTLTFVAVHEMSHIASKSIGHKQEFWDTFKFFLKEAVAVGIYEAVDYQKKPVEFCGLMVKDNPYYNHK